VPLIPSGSLIGCLVALVGSFKPRWPNMFLGGASGAHR
jgi:hypothetical protein